MAGPDAAVLPARPVAEAGNFQPEKCVHGKLFMTFHDIS